ncbi:hypothetical protein HMPREF1980_00987 [Actinomyces sp. oral taxon 172 str. F0311]|nr:hypothetical protein HMPREF1980_00987 [Actinomyces sp. oral taxon 172 str. F0311]
MLEFVVGSAHAVSATAAVVAVRAARIFVECMVMFLSICIVADRRY